MNNKEFILEILKLCISKKLSKWAATMFILSGIAALTPQWWYGLANTLYFQVTQSNLKPFEESPTTGWVFIFIGLVLVFLNVWESKKARNKEILGIRHISVADIPPEAIKRDLPYIQRLWHYSELAVDHSDSYNGGILEDYNSVLRALNRIPDQLDGILQANSDTPLAYYGLTHIPLAFYLGYLLSDNKYHIQLYELNNTERRWNQLGSISSPLDLKNNKNELEENAASGNVIVTIGISYPVHPTEVDELEITNELARINIEALMPQRQLICSQEQIEQLCKVFRRSLEQIKNAYPNRDKTHIFYSGPVSLAFALGRVISERIDSEIVIHNYSVKESPKYSWSLSFNGSNPAHISKTTEKGEERDSIQYA
ncbi:MULTISPECIES: SAVED domain-containing protein [unclassified Shewanella]|uniref:SAVED domain-containing protein n=1 Tax=unclassified Shewanella TaxID=196818 RepID=UPI003552E853